MNQDLLIWLTGFWEGEGYFGIRKIKTSSTHSKSYNVGFTITQSGERGRLILTTLRNYFQKGRVILKREARQYNDCYRQDSWIWEITKRMDIYEMLIAMLPYMQFRKREVEDKLEVMINVSPKFSKELKLKQLTDITIRENRYSKVECK